MTATATARSKSKKRPSSRQTNKRDRTGNNYVNARDDVTILEALRKGEHLSISLAVRCGADWIYLPVYARIRGKKLIEWTNRTRVLRGPTKRTGSQAGYSAAIMALIMSPSSIPAGMVGPVETPSCVPLISLYRRTISSFPSSVCIILFNCRSRSSFGTRAGLAMSLPFKPIEKAAPFSVQPNVERPNAPRAREFRLSSGCTFARMSKTRSGIKRLALMRTLPQISA